MAGRIPSRRQAAEHEHQAQAQRDRLIASYRAQRAASQQAELDALLLETVAALAGLFSAPDHPATTQPDRHQQRSPPTPAGTSTSNAAD